MLRQPQFKAHFHVEIVKGEGVFLISELGHSVLNGDLFEWVVPLIDGRRSADEIVERLQAQASPAEVYYALALLEQKGYLVESDQTPFPSCEAAFWTIQGIDPSMAAHRLAETEVSVTNFGNLAAAPFIA